MALLLWNVFILLLALFNWTTARNYDITLYKYENCTNATVSEQDVVRRVLNNQAYSKYGRPVKASLDKPITISIGMRLSGIQDFLERQNTLILTGYVVLEWWDQFLVWNMTWPLACIDRILLPIEEIWQPDLACVNSADHIYEFLGNSKSYHALVRSSGYVIHNPVGQIRVSCSLDLTYFPFDLQACAVRFESWMLPDTMERLLLIDSPFQRVGDNLWTENEQWHIVGNHSYIIKSDYYDGDKYDHVIFLLLMKRKFVFYVVNIVTPSILISAVELVIFLLPTTEVLKIHISFTCLLAYSVFQTMVIGDLPRSSDSVPLLSLYIDLQMIFLSLSLLGEGVVFLLAERSKGEKETPQWLMSLCKIAARILLVEHDVSLPLSSEEGGPSAPSEAPPSTVTATVENNTEIATALKAHPASLLGDFVTKLSKPKPKARAKSFTNLSVISEVSSNGNSTSTDAETSLDSDLPSQPPRPRIDRSLKLIDIARRNEDSKRERQRRWMLAAEVAERFNACFYAIAISVTPIVMFAIVPHGIQSIDDEQYWQKKFSVNFTTY